MGRPAGVPITAIPVPPPGGANPMEQTQFIAGVQQEVVRENTVNLANAQAEFTDWVMTNDRNRMMNIPITPKPPAFVPQVVSTVPDDVATSGVIWMWISEGTPVECPDLPPIPTAPGPNHVHIVRLITGSWFAAGQDDTYPATNYPAVAAPPVNATSDDGVSGTFVKYSAPVGPGWYLKQA